jgi:hypothetical protein
MLVSSAIVSKSSQRSEMPEAFLAVKSEFGNFDPHTIPETLVPMEAPSWLPPAGWVPS